MAEHWYVSLKGKREAKRLQESIDWCLDGARILAKKRPDLALSLSLSAEQIAKDRENILRRNRHRVPKKELPFCGARTRTGETCKARVVRGRMRCRMHGGTVAAAPQSP